MTPEEARKLQKAVDEILEVAYRQRNSARFERDAINWADLRCTDVEERTSLLNGHTITAVTIEEASETSTNLHTFVGEQLEQRGYPDIYVATEW